MEYPKDLMYTHEHLYFRKQEEGAWVVGLTHHALELLGEIAYVELHDVEDRLEAGATLAVIESVKEVTEYHIPARCKVVAVNEEVVGDPALLQEECYGRGWLVSVMLDTDSSSGCFLECLMDVDQYSRYVHQR